LPEKTFRSEERYFFFFLPSIIYRDGQSVLESLGKKFVRKRTTSLCNFFVVLFLSLSPRPAAVSSLNEKMRNFDDDDEDDDDSDDSEGEFADEGDWYASLIAGERVGEWLDVIEEETKQQRSNDDEEKEEEEEGRRNRRRTKNDDDKRFRSAIEQLTKHVEEDEVYGEEAEVAEAERILSEALAKVSLTTNIDDDEEEIEKETSNSSSVQKLLRQSLEAIETHRKRKKNVKTYAMKNGRVEVSILETKLSNGVGGKLWKAALLLAEQLDDKEGEPKDDDDDDDGVIIDVKDKTVLELGAGVGLVGFAAAKLGAKEVVLSDFEAPLLEALAESVERNGSEKTTKVRWLDWRADGASNTEKTEPPDAFLALEKEDTYDIILGSDCLYESHHATLLPKVINKRLSSSPNARCRLLGAVRNREMLDQLIENFRKCENLRATETSVAKSERLNYDGGYVRVDIKRKSF